MDKIIEFLEGLQLAFSSILNAITGFFDDTVYVIKLTGSFVSKIPEYLSWLPSPVIVLFVSIFIVVVIYKVLGREG